MEKILYTEEPDFIQHDKVTGVFLRGPFALRLSCQNIIRHGGENLFEAIRSRAKTFMYFRPGFGGDREFKAAFKPGCGHPKVKMRCGGPRIPNAAGINT